MLRSMEVGLVEVIRGSCGSDKRRKTKRRRRK